MGGSSGSPSDITPAGGIGNVYDIAVDNAGRHTWLPVMGFGAGMALTGIISPTYRLLKLSPW